jgi:hypothetical protein
MYSEVPKGTPKVVMPAPARGTDGKMRPLSSKLRGTHKTLFCADTRRLAFAIAASYAMKELSISESSAKMVVSSYRERNLEDAAALWASMMALRWPNPKRIGLMGSPCRLPVAEVMIVLCSGDG